MIARTRTKRSVRRLHALIVGYRTGPDDRVLAVLVRCGHCRGTHWHAVGSSADTPRPYCGTPGVSYVLVWPQTESDDNQPDDNYAEDTDDDWGDDQ